MDVKKLIESIPILNKIFNNVPERLISGMKIKEIPANITFIQKNEEVTDIHILCKGKLGIFNHFPSGDLYYFAEQSAVNFVGEIEAISRNQFYACDNKTLTKCVFIIMKKEIFMEVFSTNLNFSNFVAEILAKKIYPRSYFSGYNIIYPLKYNLIAYILNYTSQHTNNTGIITLNETRQVLADKLGVNVRSINRRIKELREIGLINIVKGKITISNKQLHKLKVELQKYK